MFFFLAIVFTILGQQSTFPLQCIFPSVIYFSLCISVIVFCLVILTCGRVLCVFPFMNKLFSTSSFPGSKFECLSYARQAFVSIIRLSLDGGSICHHSRSVEPLGWVVWGDIGESWVILCLVSSTLIIKSSALSQSSPSLSNRDMIPGSFILIFLSYHFTLREERHHCSSFQQIILYQLRHIIYGWPRGRAPW